MVDADVMCNRIAVTRGQIIRLHNRYTALAKTDDERGKVTYVCYTDAWHVDYAELLISQNIFVFCVICGLWLA